MPSSVLLSSSLISNSTERTDDVRRMFGADTRRKVVAMKTIVNCLKQVGEGIYEGSEQAREFAYDYLEHIVNYFLDDKQDSPYFECGIEAALDIIIFDLAAKSEVLSTGVCKILDVLADVYLAEIQNENIRIGLMSHFNDMGGFTDLSAYLLARVGTPLFPSIDTLLTLLTMTDSEVSSNVIANTFAETEQLSEDAVRIVTASKIHLDTLDYDGTTDDYPDEVAQCRELMDDIMHFVAASVIAAEPEKHIPVQKSIGFVLSQPQITTLPATSKVNAFVEYIHTANQILRSAETWEKSTAKSLEDAKAEHVISARAVENARSHLEELKEGMMSLMLN